MFFFFQKFFFKFFFKKFSWFYKKKKLSFILNNCINFTVDQPFKKNYTIHANLLSTTNFFLPKSHEFLPKFLDVLKELNKFRFDLGYLGLKKAHKATHTHISFRIFFFDSIFRFYFSFLFFVIFSSKTSL